MDNPHSPSPFVITAKPSHLEHILLSSTLPSQRDIIVLFSTTIHYSHSGLFNYQLNHPPVSYSLFTMPNTGLPNHSKPDRKLYRQKELSLPLQLLLLPVLLPLTAFILVFVDLSGTQGDPDDSLEPDREPEPDLATETSGPGQERGSRSAAGAARGSSRPDTTPSCTCRCHQHQGPNELISGQPPEVPPPSSSPRLSLSSGSADAGPVPDSAETSPLGGSETYDSSAAEEAAGVPTVTNTTMPARTGAGSPIIAHATDPVSPQTLPAAPGTTTKFLALTDSQQPKLEKTAPTGTGTGSGEERANEQLRRRNVRMREEGVRVRVNYLQLTNPVSAWKATTNKTQARGGDAAAAAAAIPCPSSSPSASGPPTPPTPSSSPSGSEPVFLSLPAPQETLPAARSTRSPSPSSSYVVVSPAATPPGPSTQQQQEEKVLVSSSVLPTSGSAAAAGPALVQIQEKLLAVPADATSRRLLKDGRAILKGKVRTPRSPASSSSASSRGGGGGGSGRDSGCKSSDSGYPSELME